MVVLFLILFFLFGAGVFVFASLMATSFGGG
jgi:hypothetical protein